MLCFCKFVEVVSKYRKRQYGFTELLNVDPCLSFTTPEKHVFQLISF